MFIIKRNPAGQQQVIFKASGNVAVTFPNRTLCRDWIMDNYPEYVEGTAQYMLRKATEKAVQAVNFVKACNEPLAAENVLNASVGHSVWRGRS